MWIARVVATVFFLFLCVCTASNEVIVIVAGSRNADSEELHSFTLGSRKGSRLAKQLQPAV